MKKVSDTFSPEKRCLTPFCLWAASCVQAGLFVNQMVKQ